MKRVRYHPFSLHMALNNLHSKLKSYLILYNRAVDNIAKLSMK